MNQKTRKTLSWILIALGLAVLGAGLVLRFAFHHTDVTFNAAALSLIGLSLSLEYAGEKFRMLLRVCQALAGLVIIANAVSWLVDFPNAATVAMQLAAIAVNLPLAALGLKKGEKAAEAGEEAPEE
ncbi:MAG: hypothetical protein FWF60_04670 [Oscillospiraceae bacterium]|nr:hypothetical protein [Oscillospiraceae bacterium]